MNIMDCKFMREWYHSICICICLYGGGWYWSCVWKFSVKIATLT